MPLITYMHSANALHHIFMHSCILCHYTGIYTERSEAQNTNGTKTGDLEILEDCNCGEMSKIHWPLKQGHTPDYCS